MAHFRITTIQSLNSIHEAIEIRADFREIRSSIFYFANKLIAKLAFDTRRINQETTYIPRRNLQNYHRSAEFIDDEMAIKNQTPRQGQNSDLYAQRTVWL